MRKTRERLDFLKNNRARIVFFSCIAEPHTVSEISKKWGYKSVTYLYQKNMVEEMAKRNLIKVVTKNSQRYCQSNYDFVFNMKSMDTFFARLNEDIETEIIVKEYDYEISESQLEDKLFREFCIHKRKGLQRKIEKIHFDEQDRGLLVQLWKNLTFRKMFLSLEILTKLMRRDELPENPVNLLFDFTYQIFEEIYSCIRQIEYAETFYSPDVYIRLEKVLVPWIETLNKLDRSEIASLTEHFGPAYRAIEKKFMTYEPPSEVRFYHMKKLVELLRITS